ncbi:hypothetical protein BC828DRAFT_382059 [Blastocladiella britannica]|nr:hypothetical protein BC828DRAFT_382059 [Blastocladiella britannica]
MAGPATPTPYTMLSGGSHLSTMPLAPSAAVLGGESPSVNGGLANRRRNGSPVPLRITPTPPPASLMSSGPPMMHHGGSGSGLPLSVPPPSLALATPLPAAWAPLSMLANASAVLSAGSSVPAPAHTSYIHAVTASSPAPAASTSLSSATHSHNTSASGSPLPTPVTAGFVGGGEHDHGAARTVGTAAAAAGVDSMNCSAMPAGDDGGQDALAPPSPRGTSLAVGKSAVALAAGSPSIGHATPASLMVHGGDGAPAVAVESTLSAV